MARASYHEYFSGFTPVSAALQGVRDAKLGAPVVARALAVVHTCMYDTWAGLRTRAIGTQPGGALRRPASERTLADLSLD
jgi:hypothetical protein